MPLYRYECNVCGFADSHMMTFAEHDEDKALGPVGCGRCTRAGRYGYMRQVYGVNINKGMPEHYSDQLDTVVKSDAHFRSELSRQQDEMSQRMGFDVKYDTIDPNDPKAAGVTDAGLESQERAAHAEKSDGHKSVFS